jgi:hypothetical protein
VRADEKLRFWNSNRLFGVAVNCLDKLASFFRNYPDMKPRIPSVLITFTLVCCALSPKVQGVVPPPDGGYPNFTTAEGQKALFSLTTGSANTAVGWFSLFSNAGGSFNTATGAGSLLSTPQTTIRRLARRRFYSTPPALATQPLARPPF